jgi:hypothetical protein
MRFIYSAHLRESRACRHRVSFLFTGPGVCTSAVVTGLALKRAVVRAGASGLLLPLCAAESVDGGESAFLLFLESVAPVDRVAGSTRAFFLHFLLDFSLVFGGCIFSSSSYRRVNSVAPSQCWTYQTREECSRCLSASRCSNTAGSSRLVNTSRGVVIFGLQTFNIRLENPAFNLQSVDLGELDACGGVVCEIGLVTSLWTW